MIDDAKRARLAELRKAEAEKDQAAADKRDEQDLDRLELLARFEKELGPRGQEFELLDCTAYGAGFVVVKLGTAAEYEQVKKSDLGPQAAFAFVGPNLVHPGLDEFRKVVERRPIILERAALALHSLFGDRTALAAKKV